MTDQLVIPSTTVTFENHTLADRIFRVLKTSIIRQEYTPGSRLVDQEVADRLGVSRTPVREAINRLAAEGLLEITPRRGVFVVALSQQEIKELYDVREALEILALELAENSLTDEKISKLEITIADYRSAFDKGDLLSCFDLDRRFHECLVESSGNSVLIETYRSLSGKIQISRWRHCHDRARTVKSLNEHEAILNALANHDVSLAKELTHHHIHTVKIELLLSHQTETR
jgi:DNA-binding GntR family transcriptional regulator